MPLKYFIKRHNLYSTPELQGVRSESGAQEKRALQK
jgi:hypothetical protein